VIQTGQQIMVIKTLDRVMKELPKSSPEQWRLTSDEGDGEWIFVNKTEASKRPQSLRERQFLGLKTNTPKLKAATSYGGAANNGWAFYEKLQMDDGHWAGGSSGPSYLLPVIIFAMYITDSYIPPEWKTELVRYLQNTVNEDGGWGMHPEGSSSALATGLNYVMLRLFGIERDVELLADARECFLSLGGATSMPQLGKVWLALLNLYDWTGVNPITADSWTLPTWSSHHPWRTSLQHRSVHLPASYLWSNRFSKELNPLLKEIREEIFVDSYSSVDFVSSRYTVSPTDWSHKPSCMLLFLNAIILIWINYLRPQFLLHRANEKVTQLIQQEDEATDYNCFSALSKAFQLVTTYVIEGNKSPRLQHHREKIPQYLWMSELGMTCSSTNGSQVWDTALSIQAAAQAGFAHNPEFRPSIEKAYEFISSSQLFQNLPSPYQQRRSGGWPFSTRSTGHITSRSTAEALKATLMLHNELWPIETNLLDNPDVKPRPPPFRVPAARLGAAMETLLAMQNSDGGWGQWERNWGPNWLEKMGSDGISGGAMLDKSYLESTAAAISALAAYSRVHPSHGYTRVRKALRRSVRYLFKRQREDGSWPGSLSACYTYPMFLVIMSLDSVGEQFSTSEEVVRACAFLLSKQREDGGWGEHWTGSETGEYMQHPEKSQVVHTAWAVLALMFAKYSDEVAIEKGLKVCDKSYTRLILIKCNSLSCRGSKQLASGYKKIQKEFPITIGKSLVYIFAQLTSSVWLSIQTTSFIFQFGLWGSTHTASTR
jgi:lanosterol synthase